MQDSEDESFSPTVETNRRQSTAEPVSATSATAPPPPADVEVDVMNDAVGDEVQEQDDHRSEHLAQRSAVSGKSLPRSKGKAHADGPPARKKARRVVVSESEDEHEDYMDTVPDAMPEDNDDDYLSPDEKPTKISKGKRKASSSGARTGKGTKRKARAEPSEAGHSGTEKKPVNAFAAGKKRPKPPPKLDETLIDVVGDTTSMPEAPATVEQTSPAAAKQDSPAPTAILKKPKLPTIKKTKLAGPSGLSTPLSATAPAKKLPLELGANSKLTHRETLINKRDIDLSNKSIYQELFSKTGPSDGGTPRRTKEEERRKELNRLRDEAKARRAAEACPTGTFVRSTSSIDKISRFEDKLKAEHSSALYPNFLAGKWRDHFERERRRQKEQQQEQQWQEAVYESREEGEVN
ncbi:hypothetical protein BDZ97DRAFT_1815100 [Flammula alnicola]|nr:hypothetical protein BDZ97DRAFT_1815100 [Flammula alnicola]